MTWRGVGRRLYQIALLAYPASERQANGREMKELFDDLMDEADATRGPVAVLGLGIRAIGDAALRGLVSRMRRYRAKRLAVLLPDRTEPRLVRYISSVGRDVRYAVRAFARTPVVSLVAIAVFTIGIGASAVVFSVVEAVLLRPLPFASPHQLFDVVELHPRAFERGELRAGGGLVTYAAYRAWAERATSFEEMSAYTAHHPLITGLGEPMEARAYPVESHLFQLLGASPLHGRGFLPNEDQRGAPRVVVIGHAFWLSRFGGDPAAVGGTLMLDGEPYEIVGVMPPEFRFPIFADAMRPLVWLPMGLAIEELDDPANRQGALWIVARLREGIARVDAQAELDAVLEDLEATGLRPDWRQGWRTNLTPLHAWASADARYPLLMLQAAVALVFLISCSNVANLLLARGAARSHELSVRMALGAGSRRIATQLLTESLALSAAGGVLGIAVAHWATPVVLSFGGGLIPEVNDVELNAGVLAALVGGTILAGVMAGCVPAFRAAYRARSGSLVGRGPSSSPDRRLGQATGMLVVAQVALSLVLLTGAGLLVRSVIALLDVELGFATQQRWVAEIEMPQWRYPEAEQRMLLARGLLSQVQSIPSVEDVALTTFAPFEQGMISSVTLPDRPDAENLAWATISGTTPDYFRIVEIPLLAGRLYDDADVGGEPVAVIDEAAAQAYFPGANPVGQRLATYRWRDRPLTVIGVVGNVREDSVRRDAPPHVYTHTENLPASWLRVLVHSADPRSAVADELREVIRALDPIVPITRVAPLRALVVESLQEERFYASLLGMFAAAALLMAGVGIFGVMRYAVTRRVRELGIRVALGARARDIVRLVAGRALGLTVVGVVLGLTGAAAATRVLSQFLYGLSPIDPLTFAAAAAVLCVLALLACSSPARRASRVDPSISLRAE